MIPIERATRAVADELVRQEQALDEMSVDEKLDFRESATLIDGYFDLAALTRAVLRAIREPSEAWFSAAMKLGYERNTITVPGDYPEFWQGMIDAALEER